MLAGGCSLCCYTLCYCFVGCCRFGCRSWGKRRLMGQLAQDGNNKIFPIAFTIVEGETKESWSFFLNNLGQHVTPQANICLISDRHVSIKSVYDNPQNGWHNTPTSHVFCVRHISQNFMRAIKDGELKKKVEGMGKNEIYLLLHSSLYISTLCL